MSRNGQGGQHNGTNPNPNGAHRVTDLPPEDLQWIQQQNNPALRMGNFHNNFVSMTNAAAMAGGSLAAMYGTNATIQVAPNGTRNPSFFFVHPPAPNVQQHPNSAFFQQPPFVQHPSMARAVLPPGALPPSVNNNNQMGTTDSTRHPSEDRAQYLRELADRILAQKTTSRRETAQQATAQRGMALRNLADSMRAEKAATRQAEAQQAASQPPYAQQKRSNSTRALEVARTKDDADARLWAQSQNNHQVHHATAQPEAAMHRRNFQQLVMQKVRQKLTDKLNRNIPLTQADYVILAQFQQQDQQQEQYNMNAYNQSHHQSEQNMVAQNEINQAFQELQHSEDVNIEDDDDEVEIVQVVGPAISKNDFNNDDNRSKQANDANETGDSLVDNSKPEFSEWECTARMKRRDEKAVTFREKKAAMSHYNVTRNEGMVQPEDQNKTIVTVNVGDDMKNHAMNVGPEVGNGIDGESLAADITSKDPEVASIDRSIASSIESGASKTTKERLSYAMKFTPLIKRKQQLSRKSAINDVPTQNSDVIASGNEEAESAASNGASVPPAEKLKSMNTDLAESDSDSELKAYASYLKAKRKKTETHSSLHKTKRAKKAHPPPKKIPDEKIKKASKLSIKPKPKNTELGAICEKGLSEKEISTGFSSIVANKKSSVATSVDTNHEKGFERAHATSAVDTSEQIVNAATCSSLPEVEESPPPGLSELVDTIQDVNLRSAIEEDKDNLEQKRKERQKYYDKHIQEMESRLEMYNELESLAEQISEIRSSRQSSAKKSTPKAPVEDVAMDMVHLAWQNYRMLEATADRLLDLDMKN